MEVAIWLEWGGGQRFLYKAVPPPFIVAPVQLHFSYSPKAGPGGCVDKMRVMFYHPKLLG